MAFKIGINLQVQTLLGLGADVNLPGYQNCIPLRFAHEPGNGQIVSWILERGANFNALCNLHIIPLHIPARHHQKLIRLLLRHGADANSIDERKESAILRGQEDILRSSLLEP